MPEPENPYQPSSDADSPENATEPASGHRKKLILFGLIALVVAAIGLIFRDTLSLASLAARENQLRQFQSEHPLGTYGLAFAIYVAVTGLSLPGAAALTLVYGWYFGFTKTLALVSFASTAGATLAFLSSRYFLRDAIETRYGDSMRTFQRNLAAEGPFYLFTLRLIPAVPFFVINLVMGLTPITARTFWWVSQLGMLPGTAVFVYAGSRVPNLNTLAEEGIGAVFAPAQLTQITIAFVLLGTFPLIVRYALSRFSGKQADG